MLMEARQEFASGMRQVLHVVLKRRGAMDLADEGIPGWTRVEQGSAFIDQRT